MNEELNSTATSLRNVFFSKVAAPEDVERACGQLAEKLAGDLASNHDAKLALLDLLEEALHGITSQLGLLSLSCTCSLWYHIHKELIFFAITSCFSCGPKILVRGSFSDKIICPISCQTISHLRLIKFKYCNLIRPIYALSNLKGATLAFLMDISKIPTQQILVIPEYCRCWAISFNPSSIKTWLGTPIL